MLFDKKPNKTAFSSEQKIILKRKILYRARVGLAVLLMVFSFSFAAVRPVYAFDPFTPIIAMWDGLKYIGDKIYNISKDLMTEAGSYALQAAISRSVNTIAYDTATWLASGSEGQKPQYFKGSFGDALKNTADLAAGNFIDTFFKGEGLNLCQPSLDAKLQIGLGLVAVHRPPQPDCTASKMINNWSAALRSINSKNFLKNFSGYFDIQQNDLGLALTAQTSLLDATEQAKFNKALEVSKNGRWMENTNIAGDILGLPDQAENENIFANNMYYANFGEFTGSALQDAANVFLNQFAITYFQRKMRELTSSLSKENAKGFGSILTNPQSGVISGGTAVARGLLRKIAEPKFNSSGDFDILAKLSICNTNVFGGVGPTDCVIDERFRQAIASQKTVKEALQDGSINGAAPFGFVMGGDSNPIEPVYNQGYPYRSLGILRKYRIIPVGWEIAAEYIQQHVNDVDVAGMNTLNRLTACFADNSQPLWCRGLIDPDWVLKAPQNYCAKEGNGPQILNSETTDQGIDEKGNKLPPEITITRADDYCADEQSCIKENSDGSCKYFGYCTEDKRKWKFGSEFCDPQFNTCQAFTTEEGDSVAYLKNSLKYCDQSQEGCEKYAIASAAGYDAAKSDLDWAKNSGFIYLNKNAGSCEASNEGCHEFLRISSNLGTNLISDSSFENGTVGFGPANWSVAGNAAVTDTLPGGASGKGVQVSSAVSPVIIYSYDQSDLLNPSVLPLGFVMEPEISYTFSADVYLPAGQGDKVVIAIGRDGYYWEETETTLSDSWQRISVTLLNNKNVSANEIKIYGISIGAVQFYIDNVKFEVGNKATNYSDYRDNNLVYEKFMPAYLRNACYTNPAAADFSLKDGAPAACRQFARQCNRDEANCELYTGAADRSKTAAAVTDNDYCLGECVGYNTFIQAEDSFSSNHIKYFIPATAKACSAAAVGCEQFTSLASTTAGGEQQEYYSYLRQCVKPTDTGVTCADFYTFEGNQTSGQQLVKYSLSQSAGGDPLVTAADGSLCNDTIYNSLPTDPIHNPDCRQFYDKSGGVSYHLYSRTITCSDDCSSYRLTRSNVVEGIGFASDCNPTGTGYLTASLSSFNWDAASDVCIYCKNGGVWDAAQNACVYKAIAGESVVCAAADNGCAEYNGNSGANSRTVLDAEFENSDVGGWSGGFISATSYVAGKSSYSFGGSVQIDNMVDLSVKTGASYVLTFLARAENNDAELKAEFTNGAEFAVFPKSVSVKAGQWRKYSLDLPALNHVIIPGGEYLNIRINSGSPSALYIDSIKLTEISNRYYLLEDTWNTPASCDEDQNGNSYPLFMLGCAEYSDRLGNIHYLHSFDRLCQETAVGCEAMIDTFNSVSPLDDNSYGSTTTVPADRVVYAVYDTGKLCSEIDKGCERLGLVSAYETELIYSNAYLINDPDQYGKTLCNANGVGCDLFTSREGASYFKDPGSFVCEWRQGEGTGKDSGWAWYKKKVKRCGGSGKVCLSDNQCAGATCRLETTADNNLLCPVEKSIDKTKTIGFGGVGNEVEQPTFDGLNYWAGACSEEQSGCTEYIDPESSFSSNVLYNGDFTQNVSGGLYADGWQTDLAVVPAPGGVQNVILEGNSLYVLTVKGNNTATINVTAGAPPIHELGVDNIILPAAATISVGANQSKIFYLDRNIKNEVVVATDIQVSSPGNERKIILKKAVVDYQIAAGIDKNSCNGTANLSAGCVYFNERAVKPTGLSVLDSNSWNKYDAASLINTSPTVNDSNALIKVSPDRDCNQWLSCKSYVKDENNKNVCFDIANCNRLDDSGNCANFVVPADKEPIARTFYDPSNPTIDPRLETPETIKNLTGYVKVGLSSALSSDAKNIPSDVNNLGSMNQVGKSIIVPNGDFEMFSAASSTNNGKTWVAEPAGWTSSDGSKWTPAIADLKLYVVSDPRTAQSLGIDYPMVGKAFLKYNAATSVRSSLISVEKDQDYYISFYVNTSNLSGPPNTKASLWIWQGNAVTDSVDESVGTGWVLKTQKFHTTHSQIRLELSATFGAAGNVYIDDIEITPVLVARTEKDLAGAVTNEFYTRQTCRLYPKQDSLSCDYYDDAGILQKGDRGYCLQYDRVPGNPDSCILWWPIDKVKGSGIQTSDASGYSGPAPLYYCTRLADRPYIDASTWQFNVDEKFSLEVNGVNVLQYAALGWDGSSCDGCIAGCLGIPACIGVCELTCGTINGSQSGVIGSYLSGSNPDISGQRIYLNYGVNTIKIVFTAYRCMQGDTHLGLVGEYVLGDGNRINLDIPKLLHDANDPTYTGPKIDIVMDRNYGRHEGSGPESDIGVDYYGGTYCGSGGHTGNYIIKGGDECDACLKDNDVTITYTFSVMPICSQVSQVVNVDGQNKVWAEKFRQSNYSLPCNIGMSASFFDASNALMTVAPTPGGSCIASTPAVPFGAANPPQGDGGIGFWNDPKLWSSAGLGPLPYWSIDPNTTGLMGQLYDKNNLKLLFVESQGVWDWDTNLSSYVYNESEMWSGLSNLCPNNIRANINDACAVAPTVTNMKLNSATNANLFGRGFVNLIFNSVIDSQQTPLVSYEIDWGDTESLAVTGMDMAPHPNSDNPHSVFHAYDYYDLLSKYTKGKSNITFKNRGIPTVNCDNVKCTVKPRVKLTDNWGWCTEGYTNNACPTSPGVCMDKNKNPLVGSTCYTNSDCSSPFNICADSWWEPFGEVIVYKQ